MDYSFIATIFVLCFIALVIFVIWFLSRKPYFYDYYVSCKKWVKEFIARRWKWFKSLPALKQAYLAVKKWVKEFIAGRWKWFRSLPALKQTYLFVAGVIAFALFILFIRLYLEILLFDWGGTGTTETTETTKTTKTTGNADSSIRNLAIAFLGTTSSIGALFGVFLAILRSEENKRQNDTAEQGLITDRINKAIEGLGKFNDKGEPIVEVRLGALYALERIAQDSIRDHIQIMELFCAYVRHASLENKADKTKKPTEDIQAALTIIGRREEWPESTARIKKERNRGYRIILHGCNLRESLLYDANLANAGLIGANMKQMVLINANMRGTWISEADMTGTLLGGADMEGTETRMTFAYRGDFSECKNLTQEQLEDMYCGMDVTIDEEKFNRPDHWPKTKLSKDAFIKKYNEWMETL